MERRGEERRGRSLIKSSCIALHGRDQAKTKSMELMHDAQEGTTSPIDMERIREDKRRGSLIKSSCIALHGRDQAKTKSMELMRDAGGSNQLELPTG